MKLVVANHFPLETVCGTTVMFVEVLRLAERAAPGIDFVYEDYGPGLLAHDDAACLVAVNAQIEVMWERTVELFAWCAQRRIPAWCYVHDYWPHHRDAVVELTSRWGARLLASTPFIAEALAAEGFASQIVPVGVPLPDVWPPVRTAARKRLFSSARLASRKRLPDIARAFAESAVEAELHLRMLPSQVFGADVDAEQLRLVREAAGGANVVIDLEPGPPPEYADWSAYVCASSYEGFGMPVIEAAFHGCPPLMSDIVPHRRSARAMFGEDAELFLYPVGQPSALAALMRDEIETGRRKKLLDARIDDVRRRIVSLWSLETTARALAEITRYVRS